ALARGTLAHQLLEHLAGLGAAERRGRAAALAERLAPELPDSMCAGLCSVVLDVFEQPEFAFMFAANSRAEVRIAGELDGRLVEGQIDRLVVTNDEVTVIDFKTGAPPESWPEAPVGYRDQIADYVALLANTYPGRNIRGMLFYIEGPVLLSKTGNKG
ncbi:double-strand break repair helicase AddA, partial [Candidatus Poribacteria bacterium]|nr:double-strand break repair helicase AddA [Candidatus Poribacteria bacterium]